MMGRRLWAAWPERRLKPIFEREVMEKDVYKLVSNDLLLAFPFARSKENS